MIGALYKDSISFGLDLFQIACWAGATFCAYKMLRKLGDMGDCVDDMKKHCDNMIKICDEMSGHGNEASSILEKYNHQ
jgi:hypothetical protein